MRISIEQTVERLKEADDILILTHQSPDGDSIGCAAALCEALRSIGKTAYVQENPELTEPLAAYSRPFHAPDGFVPQMVMAVDIADTALLTMNAEQYANSIALCIDHHHSNRGYAAETYLDSEAAACAEPMYEIIKLLGVPLSRSMAACLYLAETTDTGGFRYPSVTSRSMRYGADFIETGIDFYDINRVFLEMRSLGQLRLEAFVLSHCKFSHGGRVVIGSVSIDELANVGACDADTSNISSYLRSIEGVELSLFLREREPGKWRLSARSEPPYSAAQVCLSLGGGGHMCAAGANIDAPKDKALRMVGEAADTEAARHE